MARRRPLRTGAALALVTVAATALGAGAACPFGHGRALLADQASDGADGADPAALATAASPSPLAGSPFYVPGHTASPLADHAPRFAGAAELIERTTARLAAAIAADEEASAAGAGAGGGARRLLSGAAGKAAAAEEGGGGGADDDAKDPKFFFAVLDEILDEAVAGTASSVEMKVANKIRLAFMDKKLASAYKVFSVLRTKVTDGLTLRQSFHDCGTYNRYANSTHAIGGCNGSIRFEYDAPYNAGLNQAYAFIWAGKQILDLKYPNTFSIADCIAVAGACAVAANSGPLVNVGYGRVDAHGADAPLGIGTHGDVGKDLGIQGLLADWTAYGFTPRTLCILSGGHTMGISGQAIPQSRLGDATFNNGYYRDVLAGRGFFASDKALADSPLTLPCVEAAAQSQDWFFQEWAREFFEMTWWGTQEQGIVPKGLDGREFFAG